MNNTSGITEKESGCPNDNQNYSTKEENVSQIKIFKRFPFPLKQ